MNAMTEAFVKAGVPAKSMRERAWTLLKDVGPMAPTALASRMGLPEEQAAQTLRNMRYVGTVESIGPRGNTRYAALGQTYEDARTYGRKAVRVTQIRPEAAPAAQPTPRTGAARLFELPKAMQDMSITQLREVRSILNSVFG